MAQIIKFLEKYNDIIGFYVNNDKNNNDNNNNNNNYNNAIISIPGILIEKVKEKKHNDIILLITWLIFYTVHTDVI